MFIDIPIMEVLSLLYDGHLESSEYCRVGNGS